MARLKLIIFFISQTLTVAKVYAADDQIMFKGVDITPAVKYFEMQVRILDKPVVIYNWSTNEAFGDDPKNAYAERGSESFWDNYGGTGGSGNMYGYGLYFAADPVASRGFGGLNFLLTEATLPKGFRFLDFLGPSTAGSAELRQAAEKVMASFKCPSGLQAEPLFRNGGSVVVATCQELTRELFYENIAIDGFAYGYSDTNYKACNYHPSQRAFVVTDAEWIRPGLIHYFTRNSTRDKDQRILIQTVSLMENEQDWEPAIRDSYKDEFIKYLTAHQDRHLAGSKSVCEGAWCKVTARFCDSQGACDEIQVAEFPRAGGANIEPSNGGTLLWNDLKGLPKSTIVNRWLQDNKYSCDGKLPYTYEN